MKYLIACLLTILAPKLLAAPSLEDSLQGEWRLASPGYGSKLDVSKFSVFLQIHSGRWQITTIETASGLVSVQRAGIYTVEGQEFIDAKGSTTIANPVVTMVILYDKGGREDLINTKLIYPQPAIGRYGELNLKRQPPGKRGPLALEIYKRAASTDVGPQPPPVHDCVQTKVANSPVIKTLTTKDGRTFTDAKILREDDDTVTVQHSKGIVKLKREDL